MNGRELMAEARKQRPDLKVLFMTGYSRNAIVHQGRLDPGIEMIQKPMSQRELAGRIRDLLDAAPPGKAPPRRRRRTRDER
jgi:DNA-binding response OmpR family regulator